MTNERIYKILEAHQHWLNQDCKGWKNMRANFQGEFLCGADLGGANLKMALLQGANLYMVDLCGANLGGADLCNANLRCANLSNTALWKTCLQGANLSETNLRGAYLYEANLKETNLQGADLCHADLCEADLLGADLRYADFHKTSFRGAKNIPYIPMICPEEGSFIGWKKCSGDLIVKLRIPEDALRSSATSRKCRCDKAEVLAIYNFDGTVTDKTEAMSTFDYNFIYRVGDTVSVDNFNEDRWNECSTGIHFFMNRQEAINYNI